MCESKARAKKTIHDFGQKLELLVLNEGKQLSVKEMQLARLADIVIDLFACSALISRLHHHISIKGVKESTTEQLIARLFVNEAIERINRNTRELITNHDQIKRDLIQRLAQQKGYTLGLSKYNFIK